jgi:hypothetical protein
MFLSRQTMMPKLDQPPFYIDISRGHRRRVSQTVGPSSFHRRRAWPMCVTIYFGSERENGCWSGSCRLRLCGRNFRERSFSESWIIVAPASRSYFAVGFRPPGHHAPRCSGIGVQQNAAFSLPGVRSPLFDREHESREDHGSQNSRCKPYSIAIESSDRVPYHWSPFWCLYLRPLNM